MHKYNNLLCAYNNKNSIYPAEASVPAFSITEAYAAAIDGSWSFFYNYLNLAFDKEVKYMGQKWFWTADKVQWRQYSAVWTEAVHPQPIFGADHLWKQRMK